MSKHLATNAGITKYTSQHGSKIDGQNLTEANEQTPKVTQTSNQHLIEQVGVLEEKTGLQKSLTSVFIRSCGSATASPCVPQPMPVLPSPQRA